jgi:hypothetical protein
MGYLASFPPAFFLTFLLPCLFLMEKGMFIFFGARWDSCLQECGIQGWLFFVYLTDLLGWAETTKKKNDPLVLFQQGKTTLVYRVHDR